MPCDTIQRSKVSFKLNATDTGLLKTALTSLGYSVGQTHKGLSFSKYGANGTFVNGEFKATINGREEDFDVNEVKRAYSKEVVKATSKRFGWNLKETGENQYEVVRRF